MKIRISKESLTFGSLVKMVATGYALGFGVFYLFAFVVMLAMSFFHSDAAFSLSRMLVFFAVVPIVLVLQGLLVGVIVNFGLWIYKFKKPISIELEE